jgi:hypothetical protein
MRAHAASLRKQEDSHPPCATISVLTHPAACSPLPVIPHIVRRTTIGLNAALVRAAAGALRGHGRAVIRVVVGGILMGCVIAIAASAFRVRQEETPEVAVTSTVPGAWHVGETDAFARDPPPSRVEVSDRPVRPPPTRPLAKPTRRPRGYPTRGNHLATSRTSSHKPTRR